MNLKLAWYRRVRWLRWMFRGLVGLLILLVAMIAWAYWQLHSSLPVLDGEIAVSGLTRSITIERDAHGTPTIDAARRTDAAFALGFLHAQDRFFQMDLLRRVPAGRLSELVGAAAVENDKAMRVHRFQALADQVISRLPPEHRRLLDVYTEGVNAGLQQLASRPFEYWLFRQQPQRWQAADCFLVMMAMMCDLQDESGQKKLAWQELRENVPADVFDFLVRTGSAWDAAIDGSMIEAPAIPTADVWSLRDEAKQQTLSSGGRRPLPTYFEMVSGSNNWAVDKTLGQGRRALLASDMHLPLRVPAIWYRVAFRQPRQMVGVTLPGTPLLVSGSNGQVAWGFTNSYGDFSELIELQMLPEQPNTYMTPDGLESLVRYTETIQFPGGSTETEYWWSQWGPVVARDGERVFVHRWVGHDPEAFDLGLYLFESASSTAKLLELANQAGMPHNNVVAVDANGNIGWTVCGRLPRRQFPWSPTAVDWSDGSHEWSGFLQPDEYPRMFNPGTHRLWTANNRIVGEEMLEKIGNIGYDLGARARQIRNRLYDNDSFDEATMLAIQLDDEAAFLDRWQKWLLASASSSAKPLSVAAIKWVEEWGNHAAVDSVGYRLVREFRVRVIEILNREICEVAGLKRSPIMSLEDVTAQLLDERPLHWLPQRYQTWDELLADAARTAETDLTRDQTIEHATWGQRNLTAIRHPVSNFLSSLSPWLDMPAIELPGDNHMPRVQGPGFGASMRMVVTPGREDTGIYHQPGGPSGHPLSPFYRSGYDDWANGTASPLLPREAVHRLVLKPGK